MTPIFHDRQFSVNVASDEQVTLDVQVYYRDDCRQVAVVTPLTGAAFRLADIIDAVANRLGALGYDFDYLLEHFPQHEASTVYAEPESFDLVCFRWDPQSRRYHVLPPGDSWQWQHMCRDEAEAIIGQPLLDVSVSSLAE